MSNLRLFLLGAPHIERAGEPVEVDTRKAIALAAYLSIEGQPHTREALAALLWPEYDQERAYANLRRTLWSLTKALGPEWLEVDRESVHLVRGDGFWLDVAAFRAHLAACNGHDHPEGQACPDCVARLSEAVAQYRDDFMAGFSLRDSPPFDEWQFFQAESLRRDLAGALERLAHLHAARGQFEPAIGHARRWLALDPLHEPAHRMLMQLYARSGQQSAALRQYQTCVQLLERELGAPPEEETARLHQAIRSRKLAPPAPAPPRRRHNLPAESTPFVGRSEELAEIARLLADPDCRLLTLVGPGGAGKTRLSLQAAAAQADAFADGICFVPLAPLASTDLVVPTMSNALDLPSTLEENPQRRLFHYLADKHMLFVLDNFEHLIDGAELLDELLRYAAGIKLLVTSRERLNLRGEWVFDVRGMRFPMSESDAAVEEYSAVKLFVESARRVDVGFDLTPGDVPHVARICRLVEGMPLGIELAAAWVKVLPVAEIAAEIERTLDFLTTSMRGVPTRHRSLRAVFQHSWELLDDTERAVLPRLSLFRGEFTRAAAQSVAGADLRLLSALVDKSLLRCGAAGRYGMHEVLRQYAAEHLPPASAEYARAMSALSDYYAAFLAAREKELRATRVESLREVGQEIENVRAGWQWAVDAGDWRALGRYLEGLFYFYEMRSWFREGADFSKRTVEALRGEDLSEEQAFLLAQALASHGWFLHRLGEYDHGLDVFREARTIFKRIGMRSEGIGFYILAFTGSSYEEAEDGLRFLESNLGHWIEQGDLWHAALGLRVMGDLVLYRQGYPDGHNDAVRFFEDSLAMFKELGNVKEVSYNLDVLAHIAQHTGEYEEARRLFQESLDVCREAEYLYGVALALDRLGFVHRLLGDYDAAEQMHRESLAIAETIGDQLSIGGSLDNLALVAYDRGAYEQAEAFARQGLMARQPTGEGWSVALSHKNLGSILAVQGKVKEAQQHFQQAIAAAEAVEAHWVAGWALGGLGNLCSRSGQPRLAREYFDRAIGNISHMRHINTFAVLDVLLDLGQFFAASGAEAQAVELLAFLARFSVSSRRVREAARRMLDALPAHPAGERLAHDAEAGDKLKHLGKAIDWAAEELERLP
ncbi:MAG: tetratricopeptide repeat protein [Anaerolineae bacterium]|nr:tetratricopeptide repeat protein [Anaerolineae bacterium]